MSSQTPSISLQHIDPAEALEDVPARVTTDRFTVAAEICMRARDDLARRGYKPDGAKQLRLFGIWEITTYMIPVSAQHFRRVLKANPDLPQGISEKPGGAKMFTLDEVNSIRAFLEHEGQQGKGYRPYRPKNSPAKIVSVCNFKGGVAKTTTGAHLAMAAALDGYRVLVVDLDSQASMSTMFGTLAEDEAQTAYALIARHRARHVAASMGIDDYDSRELDEDVRDAAKVTADDVIFGTHWPTIDILPAQLNLYWAEFQVPVWMQTHRSWQFWDALEGFLRDERLLEDYDIILIDTPPALGYLTINALSAADILLIPVGASFIEFDSTGRFFDMLYTTFASIEDSMARISENAPKFSWDAVQVLLTRYDDAQQAELANVIQVYLDDFVAQHRQEFTALVGQAGERVSGIYEASHTDFNRDTYRRGRETFDRCYHEFKKLLIGCWERDRVEAEAREAAE
ncbi:AAA family ATPase [Mangrovicoccus sp. HB161399]|uniref:AAA family ATPase n=1 Tax=Mangrovicoccus sp. HB161399 TaxID=2720392 RepID=UPI0015561878|nr:AAA family ATPase [Mangrovicoccus sp. HB161399]